MEPASPIYDPFRLDVIARAKLLPLPDEDTFDRIARLATRLLGVATGAVTIVHPDGQTFIGSAARGGDSSGSRGTSLRESYCRHVVESGVPLIVGDARRHPLLHDNPAIGNDAIAYAGVPVVVRGATVGTVCAVDSKPRKWNAGDLEVLGDLVRLATAAIELRLLRGGASTALEQPDVTESRFLAIFEHSHNGMFLLAPDGGILRGNSALASLLEAGDDVIALRQFTDFVHPEDREASLEAFDDVSSGRSGHREVEERCVTASGAVISGCVTMVPVRAASGAVLCVLWMKDDLSRDKHARMPLSDQDEQLVQSQKLETLGQLAGGIAHDFNNMLTVITAYAGMALSDAEVGTELHENLTSIEGAARQAAGLTQQLLSFSRRTTPHLSPVDLNGVVAAMQRMLTPIFPRSVNIGTELAPGLALVLADRVRVEQVIMNLAVNARDAMPDGGTLTFVTRNVRVDDGATESAGLRPGNYVELVVSDTGTGIPDHVLARVFEPFFTTKPAGRGTGLGLAMVQRTVTQMGGKLAVDSAVDEGTRMRVILPALSA